MFIQDINHYYRAKRHICKRNAEKQKYRAAEQQLNAEIGMDVQNAQHISFYPAYPVYPCYLLNNL